MKLDKIKKALNSKGFRPVRKVIVTVVGGLVLVAGVLMLFFPGPAFVVIPAGFAILAIEYEWARRWSRKVVEGLRYLSKPKNLKRLLYENSLTLALLALFLACFTGQIITGHRQNNENRKERGQDALSLKKYVTSGHVVEATFENWESEFLQMGALVILTVRLRQKGATDSHKLQAGKGANAALNTTIKSGAPWPVRHGGLALRLYEHSLSLSLFALFLLSFFLHAAGGQSNFNEEHGTAITLFGYMATSQFWFESFQNWQSEFFSVAVLVIFSIFLREKGSPQSKRVDAPHAATGGPESVLPATAH